MAHHFVDQYGLLSLRPRATAADAAALLPKTLPELFGEKPTAAQIEESIATLQADRLADLIYWAGVGGVQLTPELAKKLMQVGSALVRESCLAVLCFTAQPKEAARAACTAAYALTDAERGSPNVATLANLVNEKYELGFVPEAMQLVGHTDLTIANYSHSRFLVFQLSIYLCTNSDPRVRVCVCLCVGLKFIAEIRKGISNFGLFW